MRLEPVYGFVSLKYVQILIQNVAETKEASDYVLSLDPSSNPDGLLVFVGGQVLSDPLLFSGLGYGSYVVTVEVYRGPSKYDYDPITLFFGSVCDGDISSDLTLTVSYVRTCARAEFHKNLRTFTVNADKYDSFSHLVSYPHILQTQ